MGNLRGGAPKGNQNARKAAKWRKALERSLVKDADDASQDAELNAIADKVVALAKAGEQWAVQEIANRLDGKPVQPLAGDDESPLVITGILIGAIEGSAVTVEGDATPPRLTS